MSNASGLIGTLRRLEKLGNLKSRLYLVSFPILGAFEEALERPLLILGNWYRHCWSRGTSRRSRKIVLFVIYRSWRIPGIGLGLRIVDLKLRGQGRCNAVRLSETGF